MNSNAESFRCESFAEGNNLKIKLIGALNKLSTKDAWDASVKLIYSSKPSKLTIDATELIECDGIGISLLIQFQKMIIDENGEIEFLGLQNKFEEMLHLFSKDDFKTTKVVDEQIYSRTEMVGLGAIRLISDIQYGINFVGEFFYLIFRILSKPSSLKWREILKIAEAAGVNAIPIIGLIGFLLGLIMSFQSAIPMQKFGAEIFVANLVSLSLFRELGPLMTGVILAGRTASSFSAELGTMKVSEEIDALTTMGLNPVLFLVIPRVLTVVIVSPLLTLFFNLWGLIGSAIVLLTFHYPLVTFIRQVDSAVHIPDMLGGLFKSMVFGFQIGMIGCFYGLSTGNGASAVGESTTRSVVSGIISIAVADGVFSIIFYYLGI